MPELPEVETVRLGLASRITGKKIVSVSGSGARLVRNNADGVNSLVAELTGATVKDVRRRGKFIWLVLDGAAESLVIHLGMTGQIHWSTEHPSQFRANEHLRLGLECGDVARFVDPRMFGEITSSPLVEDPIGRLVPARIKHIAPDLLEYSDEDSDSPLKLTDLAVSIRGRRRAIKTLLLEQTVVSGVGNIYADEGLFQGRVHGRRIASDLTEERILSVLASCKVVMEAALEAGGTSFDSHYVDVEGNPGYFARELMVYGREDEPCLVCGTQIRRHVLQGRAHFFCPMCQIAPD